MTDNNYVPQLDAVARRQRADRFARDAVRAAADYEAEQVAIAERTALLRGQRLARDAAEAKKAKSAKAAKARKSTPRKANSAAR